MSMGKEAAPQTPCWAEAGKQLLPVGTAFTWLVGPFVPPSPAP